MSEKSISCITKELKKLTDSTYPDVLRSICSEALLFLKKPTSLPLSDEKSPFVAAIDFIFSNDTYAKIAKKIIPITVSLIEENYFSGEALFVIFNALLNRSLSLGIDKSIQLLIFTSNYAASDFPPFKYISTLISIEFNLMARPDEMISTTAVASFQQFLSYMVAATRDEKREDHEDLFSSFVLLLSDITGMLQGAKPSFLKTKAPPQAILYEVLVVFTQAACEFIIQDISLSSILQGTVLQFLQVPDAAKFVLTFFECTLPNRLDVFQLAIKEMISMIRPKGKNITSAVYFFHSILSHKHVSLTETLEVCDEGVKIMNSLLTTLISFAILSHSSGTFDLSLKTIKMQAGKIEITPAQILPYVIEIMYLITDDFTSHENCPKITKSCWESISESTMIVMRFVDIRKNHMLLSLFLKLLKTIKTHCDENDLRKAVAYIANINSLTSNGQLSPADSAALSIRKKEQLWTPFICDLVSNDLNVCSGCWDIVLHNIFLDDESADDEESSQKSTSESAISRTGQPYSSDFMLSPSFANKFSIKDKVDILNALLICRPIPYIFVSEYVHEEIESFAELWPHLESFFTQCLEKGKFKGSTVSLFQYVIYKSFDQSTEEIICKGLATIVNKEEKIDAKSLKNIISEVRSVIQKNANVINKGWLDILSIITSPSVNNNEDTLSVAASIMTLISNDCLSLIKDNEIINGIINCVFSFARQEQNINISLSSLDLLWVLSSSPLLKQSTELWSLIIEECIKIFFDKRVVLANSAVSTLFNLVSSNTDHIPESVLKNFMMNFFPATAKGLMDNETPAVMAQFIQEVTHFICGFWEKCESLDTFYTVTLPTLLSTMTKFSITCKNQELVSRNFEFYTTICGCEHFTMQAASLVFKSIEDVSDFYAEKSSTIDPNSLVLTVLGRNVGRAIEVMQGLFIANRVPTEYWAEFGHKIAFQYKSGKLVQITVQKVLEGLGKILELPLAPAQFDPLIKAFVQIIEETDNNALKQLCIKLIVTAFEATKNQGQKLRYFTFCTPIINLEVSKPLKDSLKKADIQTDDKKALFACLMVITSFERDGDEQDAANIERLISILPCVESESQEKLISILNNSITSITKIYTDFMKKDSEQYSHEMTENFFDLWLKIFLSLELKTEEEELKYILFIKNITEDTESEENRTLILKLFKAVIRLVTSTSEKVRAEVQSVLLKIEEITKSLYLDQK